MASVLREIENSSYGRFGNYLHEQHFWGTLMLALVLHLGGYAIYQMLPDYEVEEIPVRVLNIKFGGIELPNANGDEQATIQTDISAMEHLQPKDTSLESSISKMEPLTAEPSPANNGFVSTVDDTQESIDAEEMEEKTKKEQMKKQAEDKAPVKSKTEKKEVAKPKPVERASKSQTAKAKPKPETQQRYYRETERIQQGNEAGSVYGNSTQDSATIRKRYTQLLSLWIEKHKIYPAQARASGMGGQVLLRIRINRQGTIIRYYLEKATGHALLDKAVSLIVDAANPVPPVPADYPDKHNYLEFIIPINFKP